MSIFPLDNFHWKRVSTCWARQWCGEINTFLATLVLCRKKCCTFVSLRTFLSHLMIVLVFFLSSFDGWEQPRRTLFPVLFRNKECRHSLDMCGSARLGMYAQRNESAIPTHGNWANTRVLLNLFVGQGYCALLSAVWSFNHLLTATVAWETTKNTLLSGQRWKGSVGSSFVLRFFPDRLCGQSVV